MLVLTLTLLLHLDPPVVSRDGEIEFEQQQAQREVDEKYGNKRPADLTPDETRAKIRDQAEADTRVLAKFGTTPKEWARESLHRSRTQLAQKKADVQLLEAHAKAEAAAPKATEAPREVQVQRGFSDETPVTLEEHHTDGKVLVEEGLPPDALDEQAMAKELDGAGKEIGTTTKAVSKPVSKKSPAAKTGKTPKKKKKGKAADAD